MGPGRLARHRPPSTARCRPRPQTAGMQPPSRLPFNMDFGLTPPPQSPLRQSTRVRARGDSDRAKPASKRNTDHGVAPSAHGADNDTLPGAGRTGGRVSSPFVFCFLSSKPLPYGRTPYPRTPSGCKTASPCRPQRQRLAPIIVVPKTRGQPDSRLPRGVPGTRPESYGAM